VVTRGWRVEWGGGEVAGGYQVTAGERRMTLEAIMNYTFQKAIRKDFGSFSHKKIDNV
jgi:hypothetical protein